MVWQKKILGSFNRNGDIQKPLIFSNGEDTVPVYAMINPAGDIVDSASAALQAAGNELLGSMTTAMTSMSAAMNALSTAMSPLPNSISALNSALTSTLEAKVKAGNAYIASSGVIPLVLLSSPNLKITVQNPTGSGKNICIYKLEMSTDAGAMIFPTLLKNPTTNLPSTAVDMKFNQNSASSNATSVIIKAASGTAAAAMSGGTSLGPIPMPAGKQDYTDFVYVLPPGGMLGVSLTALVALNALARIFYWEEAA